MQIGIDRKSVIANHTLNNKDHRFNFEDGQIIAKPTNYHTRVYREGIEIFKHKEGGRIYQCGTTNDISIWLANQNLSVDL